MQKTIEAILGQIEKAVAGKREVIVKILTALMADGHILLDDVPGVGKTTLALAVSRAVGLSFRRIQFTPDVLPSDLVGFSLLDRDSGRFLYRPGALCGVQLVLADEINRAGGRAQSALLEAMEEKQVTVDGVTHPLETPFLVIATQNHVGASGTQILPFAQMDRFLARFSIGEPDHAALRSLLRARQTGDPLVTVQPVADAADVLRMQREVRQVTIRDSVLDYIARLTEASRVHPAVEVGLSPRAALHLSRMARARAYAEGRDYATAADVQAVFSDVCAHRMLLTRQSLASGQAETQVLQELLRTVENPDRERQP